MTLKSQVRFGKIGTIAGIVVIAGLLYYVISRKDAIIDKAYGALDNRLGGSGGGGAGPAEEAPLPIGSGPQGPARLPIGSSARRPPRNSIYRLINSAKQQRAPPPTERRIPAAQSFQNAFPNLRARPSHTNPRQLIVSDRNRKLYATSSTPNSRENFYNSIRKPATDGHILEAPGNGPRPLPMHGARWKGRARLQSRITVTCWRDPGTTKATRGWLNHVR